MERYDVWLRWISFIAVFCILSVVLMSFPDLCQFLTLVLPAIGVSYLSLFKDLFKRVGLSLFFGIWFYFWTWEETYKPEWLGEASDYYGVIIVSSVILCYTPIVRIALKKVEKP